VRPDPRGEVCAIGKSWKLSAHRPPNAPVMQEDNQEEASNQS
jgi:hypothetical protein